MNFEFRSFGNPGGTFSQYPDDDSARQNAARCEGIKNQRLVISRKDSIVTYTYCQRIEKEKYIGFGISLNAHEFTRPKALMQMMSRGVDMLLAQGMVLNTSTDGMINYTVQSMVDCCPEMDNIRAYFGYELETRPHLYGYEPLKGLPEEGTTHIDSSESDSKITALTYDYSCVVVDDSSETTSEYLGSLIHGLTTEIASTHSEIKELKDENKALQRRRKQYRVVLVLLLLLAAAGIWLSSMRDNLLSAEEQMAADSETISSLKSDLEKTRNDITHCRNAIVKIREATRRMHDTYGLPGWNSTNWHEDNSISSHEYVFYAYDGDVLSFDYYVDSEGVDRLRYNLDGPADSQNGSYSGESQRGTVEIPLTAEGTYYLNVSYSKDGSIHRYSDQASISNIRLVRTGVAQAKAAAEEAASAMPR